VAAYLRAGGLRPQALAEGFDFAGALALRLADLVKTRALDPTSSLLWRLAVDNILVKVVDSHTQVGQGGAAGFGVKG
jgi:hypothetical protein